MENSQLSVWFWCKFAGVDQIEKLQQHSNRDVYNKVLRIIEDYFESVDEETIGADDMNGDQQFDVSQQQFVPQGGFKFQ